FQRDSIGTALNLGANPKTVNKKVAKNSRINNPLCFQGVQNLHQGAFWFVCGSNALNEGGPLVHAMSFLINVPHLAQVSCRNFIGRGLDQLYLVLSQILPYFE